MKRALSSALAMVVAAGFAVAQTQTSPAAASPKSKPASSPATKKISEEDQRRQIIFNLMEEAHAAAEELPTEQRLPILQTISATAYELGDYQFPFRLRTSGGKQFTKPERFASKAEVKQLKDWSEELYRSADELAQGSYAKLEAQSAAVRLMAPLDVKRSMEMLDGLEASDAQGAEEQQNYLAMHVFTELVVQQGESALPDVRVRAQTMGEKGQYPYVAMSAVLNQVQNKEMVQAVFNDALASYQHSNDKLNSMFGMLLLLRGDSIRQKLEPSQAHEGALAIANRLRAEIDREQRTLDEGKAGRPGLALIVDGVRAGLKEVDPDLAATIPPVPPAKVAPARQSVGDVAPAATEKPELKKLKETFDKTSTRLMEMSEGEVHSGPELRQVIERGMDQAVELLHGSTHDAKDHVEALDSAMAPVTDFVQVGARTNPAMTLAAVRKVQDSEIRARMLLVIAVGLPNPKYQR